MFVRQGNDAQMMRLISDMNAGTVGAVIFYNANPVYDHPLADQVMAGIKKLALTISSSDREDETAQLCNYVCPDHHYLESWNDYEPVKGYFSFAQPAISPLFNTRQAQDSLLVWSGQNTDYYTYLQRNWRGMMGSVGASGGFQAFWDQAGA